MKLRLTFFVLIVATLVLSATSASAESRHANRRGLHVGFGLGGGHFSCEGDGCDGFVEAGSADLHIGWMLNPKLSLNAEVWAMSHPEDGFTLSHIISTVGVSYWVAPRLWLRGGVGGAHVRVSAGGFAAASETVLGLSGAVGYEVFLGRKMAIDVQLRGGTGFYDEDAVKVHNVALQVGFSWF